MKKNVRASLMTVLLNMNFLCMATKNAFVAHWAMKLTFGHSSLLSSLIKWIATKTATPAHKKSDMKTDTFIGDKCNITLADFPPLETHVYSLINRTSNPAFVSYICSSASLAPSHNGMFCKIYTNSFFFTLHSFTFIVS